MRDLHQRTTLLAIAQVIQTVVSAMSTCATDSEDAESDSDGHRFRPDALQHRVRRTVQDEPSLQSSIVLQSDGYLRERDGKLQHTAPHQAFIPQEDRNAHVLLGLPRRPRSTCQSLGPSRSALRFVQFSFAWQGSLYASPARLQAGLQMKQPSMRRGASQASSTPLTACSLGSNAQLTARASTVAKDTLLSTL